MLRVLLCSFRLALSLTTRGLKPYLLKVVAFANYTGFSECNLLILSFSGVR